MCGSGGTQTQWVTDDWGQSDWKYLWLFGVHDVDKIWFSPVYAFEKKIDSLQQCVRLGKLKDDVVVVVSLLMLPGGKHFCEVYLVCLPEYITFMYLLHIYQAKLYVDMYLLCANPLNKKIRSCVHHYFTNIFLSECKNEWTGITSFDIAAKLDEVLFWHFCLTVYIRFDMNSLV